MGRIKFDAGGTLFAIDQTFLKAGPDSKFKRMYSEVEQTDKHGPFIINRPPELFGAIISLYMLGELHFPVTSCPGAVLKEMEFWEIEMSSVSQCCMYRIEQFKDQQSRLSKFHQHIVSEPDGIKLMPCDSLSNLRTVIWSIVEYKSTNILNKLYFALVCAMIVLSILTISLGTCESFRRNMTNCERLEYMETRNIEGHELFESYIDKNKCRNTTLPNFKSIYQKYGYYDNTFDYDVDYEFIKFPEYGDVTKSPLTIPSLVSIKVPVMTVPKDYLVALELLTLGFFTVDLSLRILSCPSILAYILSIINIADAAALLCSYIHLIIVQIRTEERYIESWIDILAFMLVLRTLRLFRIAKNITAGRVLAFTLFQNLKELLIVLAFLISGVCIFSSVVYFIEKQEHSMFENIPQGWYWAVITMTTVGYGDVILVTPGGRFVSCLCAISGIVMFALTVPLFTNQFLLLYRYAGLSSVWKDSNRTSDRKRGESNMDYGTATHNVEYHPIQPGPSVSEEVS